MIGIIQKTLTECLLQAGGEPLRLAVFREAGVPPDRVFRMDQNYADEEMGRLLAATQRVTGLGADELHDLFSRTFVEVVKQVFPQFISMSANSEELVRMQAKIHALIGAGMRSKIERDTTADKFHLEDHGPHHVAVRYRSQLQLCGLYKSLVCAMAAEFGDVVDIEMLRCRKAGAEACGFAVRWLAIAGRPTGMNPRPVAQAALGR
ncbi:MAG: heme NO-binding domain-containing protein [Gemmobacter sp.]